MFTTVQKITSDFLTFVERSQAFLAQRVIPTRATNTTAQFLTFVDAATPLLLPRLKVSLPRLVERAKLVQRWLTDHDILAVAGLSYAENPYTELVAWMLAPETHPTTAVRRQKTWLQTLGLADQIDLSCPAAPLTQVRTDDGIADLSLVYSNGIIVVEVKTETVEHTAPSGAPQTVAYAESVSKRFALKDVKPHVVFLTLDGDVPENPGAIATTFVEFVVALASEIAPEELPPNLRWAFATIFTHLLDHTSLEGFNIHNLLAQVIQLGNDTNLLDNDNLLMARLHTIQQAAQILLQESRS